VTQSRPLVSVVIPTAGRSSLTRAVDSALSQVGVELEVLVVDNSTDGIEQLRLPREVVIHRSNAGDANAARQVGVAAAVGPYVALLDDDDAWHPEKLQRQIDHVNSSGYSVEEDWICGCGMTIIDGNQRILAPTTFPKEPVVPSEYLFKRTSVRDPYHQLQSSTLLFPAHVGHKLPFQATLPMHQDWTWLLNGEASGPMPILLAPDYLVSYYRGSANSITSSTRWRTSSQWATDRIGDPRIRGDFLLTVPFNMASQEGSARPQIAILVNSVRSARPGLPALSRASFVLLRRAMKSLASWASRKPIP